MTSRTLHALMGDGLAVRAGARPPGRMVRVGACAAMVALAGMSASTRAQVVLSELDCSTAPTGHVAWPASDPVWEFDFVRPSAWTTTRGAGLELRNVRFNGRTILERAHVPILNVEYPPDGGCGCFRDWSYTEAGASTGAVLPGGNECVALASPGNVVTTCEWNQPPNPPGPGGDPGSFLGVAIEDYGDELILTGNMSAAWYRYRMKWHFYLDGRIWPEYSFSAADAICTEEPHRHHAYWRFDFDFDDTPANDQITEVNPVDSTSLTYTQEIAATWGDVSDGIYWQIRDQSAGIGYDLIPSAADVRLPVDAFSKFDLAAMRYHAGVYDDGVSGVFPCSIRLQNMVNGESLVDQDIEVWYRSGAFHPAFNPWQCDIVGPLLRPEGLVTAAEPPPPASGLLIESARPNPFNPTTSVRFRVATAQRVRVDVLDVTGRVVTTLFDGWARENREEVLRIDGSSMPAGTYVVRLVGEQVEGSTRVTLLR